MNANLYGEALRPQFHFTARENWLNDPNGLVFYEDEYHLFFQHNPTGINWGNMTWGHAISDDLVHWRQVDHALEADGLGTMFSGSAVVDWDNTAGLQQGTEKTLVVIYTAAGGTSPASEGQPFTQCIAYSNDRGRTWTKYAGNPVLPHVRGENRDPRVVWHQPTHRWIMALYLDGNDFALFSSPDLKHWTQLQTITVAECEECPDFFEAPIVGEHESRWVLTAANGHYLVGSFDGQRFSPEVGPLVGDHGTNFYAVQTYSDIPYDTRRIQIAWMRGGEYPGMPFNQQMSFPCELALHRTLAGLRLFRQPVGEIKDLYRTMHQWAGVSIEPGEHMLSGLDGGLYDIEADIVPGNATEVGLIVSGQRVAYRPAQQSLACLNGTAPLAPVSGRIHLRLLVDRTSIEVFGNRGEASMTSCFLPQEGKTGVGTYAIGRPAHIASLTMRELKSMWE